MNDNKPCCGRYGGKNKVSLSHMWRFVEILQSELVIPIRVTSTDRVGPKQGKIGEKCGGLE